jgi:hypothetical protein
VGEVGIIAYPRNHQISIIEGDGINLDEAVVIAQRRNFDGFMEFQTLESVLSFNYPLLCTERRHRGFDQRMGVSKALEAL